MNGFYRHRPGVDTSGLPEPLALRPRQAAAAIGVSPTTLQRLTRAGAIASVTAGRARLYEIEELKAYLARHRSSATVAGQEVTQ